MIAILFSISFQTHSQHYSISSCACSGLHNNRRLLSSRSFRIISFWKKSLSMQILHFFPDSVLVCNHGTVLCYMVGLKWRHINLTIFFSQQSHNKVTAKYKCIRLVYCTNFKVNDLHLRSAAASTCRLCNLLIVHLLLKY